MHDEGKAMTMVDHNESVLGDNPTDEDKLGFTEPAARLADKIARFPADTPMVVGVEGKWGEGKSSFLLIMKKHWREQACLAPTGFREKLCQFFLEKVLRKKLARQIKLVEFDPWWFSGKENLLDKLLKELEGQEPWLYSPLRSLLKSLEKKASTDNVWLKSKLEVVALLLASGVSSALNPMLDWFGDSVSNAIKPWLKSGQTALLVLGLFWLIKLLLRAIIAKTTPPEGFDARKKKLETLLRKDRFQRVVFIDDLDRLPADELQEMFRVIKSVANFPNVVYVLAYDREVVSAALDKFHPGRGELFLEKIVQMPLTMPKPENLKNKLLYQEIFSPLPAMYGFFQQISEHSTSRECWELIASRLIKQPRDAKRLCAAFLIGYKPSSGMSPIYFLLLEALRLKNKLLHEKLCHVLTNPLEVMRNLEEISALNWIREHKLGKFLATEEAQCIFFISNSLRVGVAGESSEDILFLNHHLHGFGPMKKSVTYMSAVSMVMKNYVEYRRSDAMSSRLELARQLLEVKQKQKWVELVKNSGARKVLEAMYIKLVACEQIIGLESEFIDQLRSLVYFMAELFEEICCHGTIEDDIESFFCIRDLARLLIFEFCWEESRGNAFLLQIKDDRSFASKFVFFSWCNELHNRSAEILLKSFSPHFFAARDFCMLNHMLTDVFFHADKISCDVLSSWMDDFALHAKNNPRSIVIDPVILGVVKFLHKEKSIPRWLNFYGLQYLIPHLKKSIKDGCEVSCKLEAFLQDFERKNSARQILQRKYKYTRTVKSRNPSRKGFGFKSQVSS